MCAAGGAIVPSNQDSFGQHVATQKALPRALRVVPRTRSRNQGVCVLKERPSDHQNGGKMHLSCSLRHTRHRIQSHTISVFQNGHHALTVVRRCPGH